MSNFFQEYEVYTEEQSLNLLPKGEYHDAWIRHAYAKPSKNDPSKIYVMLDVDLYDSNGMPRTINQGCYLKHLLRHACEATGCLENYEGKTLVLEEHLKGKQVTACVDIQEAKDGFPAKNVIRDFKKPVKKEGDDNLSELLNDSIPF